MRRGVGVLALLVVVGCGGSATEAGPQARENAQEHQSTRSTPATTPPATTPPATTPTATATIPTVPRQTPIVPTTPTPPTTTTSPEQQPGGAGDEEAPRVPAQFTYSGGKLTPPVITVPATFRIAVDIALSDGRVHRVRIGGGGESRTAGQVSRILPGLRKGKSVTITIDGRPAGKIVSGLQPGP